jgi:hypothetical protein
VLSRQLARFYSAAGWPLGAQRAAHQPRVLTEALDAQEWHWSVRQARQEAQAAHHQSGVEIAAHGAPQPAQDSRSQTISTTTRVQAALDEAELLDKPFAGVQWMTAVTCSCNCATPERPSLTGTTPSPRLERLSDSTPSPAAG